MVTVCLGWEPHLNVLVNLKLDGEGYLQVVGPYDIGSQVSFINDSLLKQHAAELKLNLVLFKYMMLGAIPILFWELLPWNVSIGC